MSHTKTASGFLKGLDSFGTNLAVLTRHNAEGLAATIDVNLSVARRGKPSKTVQQKNITIPTILEWIDVKERLCMEARDVYEVDESQFEYIMYGKVRTISQCPVPKQLLDSEEAWSRLERSWQSSRGTMQKVWVVHVHLDWILKPGWSADVVESSNSDLFGSEIDSQDQTPLR